MVALRVSEWKRHGLDRLYVNAPDGKAVAWFDRRTGHIEVVDERLRQQILEALTPYMIGSVASPGGVASTLRTPPPSDYDLASRRPGQALREKIRADCPSLIQRSLAWALRRPENASWRTGLRGERIVSRELARLRRHGWRTLHSIPLSSTWDIDHLLIGPGGVFSINTKHHRGKTVWVGDHVARINHGEGRPYPRSSRREAAVVKKVLDRGCRFAVEVKPVLVFVKPAKLTVQPSLQDVRAIENRELSALSPLTGVLSPEQVDAVYAVARDQRSWTSAV